MRGNLLNSQHKVSKIVKSTNLTLNHLNIVIDHFKFPLLMGFHGVSKFSTDIVSSFRKKPLEIVSSVSQPGRSTDLKIYNPTNYYFPF